MRIQYTHSYFYFYRILLHRLSQSNCVGFVFISSRCLCIVEHIHSTNLLLDFSFSFVRIFHRYFCYAEWESSNSDEICEVFIYFLNDLLNFVDVQCRTVSIFVARAWIKRKACWYRCWALKTYFYGLHYPKKKVRSNWNAYTTNKHSVEKNPEFYGRWNADVSLPLARCQVHDFI